jgi:hypothetical protein|eukprot:SAG31_NODE_8380_length_1463_cov_1.343842_4_plen_73_part_00
MKKLFYNNDTYYVVLREIKVHQVSNSNGSINMEVLKAWRDYLNGDHVLRVNDSYLICETVDEPEYEDVVYTD